MSFQRLSTVKQAREVGIDPKSGKTIYAKQGKYGAYVQIGELVEGEEEVTRARLTTLISGIDLPEGISFGNNRRQQTDDERDASAVLSQLEPALVEQL